MNKNLKSFLIILTITGLFVAFYQYGKQKEIKVLKTKIERNGCDLAVDNYELGITKKEFKKRYANISDSADFNKETGYIDTGKLIKLFSGIKVKQTQFSFTKNVLCSIGFNLKSATPTDVITIKNKFSKNNDWTTREKTNEDGTVNYTYEYTTLNDCVDVTLICHPNEQKIYINFEINDSIINGY